MTIIDSQVHVYEANTPKGPGRASRTGPITSPVTKWVSANKFWVNLTAGYNRRMHGLWDGVIMTLSASAAYEYLERTRGASAPEVIRDTVGPARIQDVVRLLLEIKAWEQQTLERAPVPDESRATLTLRADDAESSIWEWYNDLAKNARFVRVRNHAAYLPRRNRTLKKLAAVAEQEAQERLRYPGRPPKRHPAPATL
jgi:hypothetical protein